MAIILAAALAIAAAQGDCEVREASMWLPQPKRPPCVAFQPTKVMQGVWIDAFEGQSFHAGSNTLKNIKQRYEGVWISFRPPARKRLPRQEGSGHAYRIRFLGRMAQDMHRQRLDGYGHFAMSAGLVVVDRLMEIEDLGCVVTFNNKPACPDLPVSP